MLAVAVMTPGVPSAAGSVLVGGGALRGAVGEDDFVGEREVGVVEEVEELGAELEAEALRDLRGLEQREIPVSVAGAYEAVAAGVADGAVGGRGKGVGVEVLRGPLGGAAAGVELAGEVWVDVGADGIAAVTGAGGVVAELRREGEAGGEADDGRDAPAGDEVLGEFVGVGEEGLAVADGQIVGGVGGEEVADVGGGGAVVEMRKGGDGDEGWRVGGDGGVPGGAVVEILGPGVVDAELQAVAEVVAQIHNEGVVVATAARPPGGGVGYGVVGLGGGGVVDDVVGEDYEVRAR